ncbi:hypothetical protein H2201_008953 [Coniosporium apollinis]|uniref:Rhodopsin domain-containing protein n=2 Tax=Coniosporium TaxID=2810619 RepID=A0ABQ9NHM0_9PEZI|nr:hypothetical protein H2199_009250 [Cladosporium sp. JES 115]KAJ9654721.1 hypothetical protein H2201_008953 [Coniosporium apollinis]
MPSPSLPAFEGERFSTITPDDHGGIIYITVLLALAYSILTLVARIGIKWSILGVDDWALVVAQTIALGQYIAVLVALSKGLGKSTSIVSSQQYALASQCPGYSARWKAVVALDVATELLFVLLPIYLVWGLQMAHSLKFRVVLGFAFRIPVAAFALAFLDAITTYHDSQNIGVAYSAVIIWHQVELGYSLIAATIPCLKSFIKSFDTGFGAEFGYSTNPYGSANSRPCGNETKCQSFPMSPIKGSKFTRVSSPQSLGRLRPEQIKNVTNIYNTKDSPREDASITSGNSQEMIIRRDVRCDVRHDYVL